MNFFYEQRTPAFEQFGAAYRPPKRFAHGEDTEVVFLKSGEGEDGQDVRIYDGRMPAAFFTIEALPTQNSVGEWKPAFRISTGSGSEMAELAASLAKAIVEGMISVEVIK